MRKLVHPEPTDIGVHYTKTTKVKSKKVSQTKGEKDRKKVGQAVVCSKDYDS